MRIGVFGGTFDPIHHGHVEPVLGAQRRLGLDQVLFVPTATPPHKDGPRGASALRRFAMAELALLDHPGLRVAALEMRADSPSFTVDTLERLRRDAPGDEHLLLLGADAFLQLPTWRHWQRIVELTPLVVMVRPGWSLEVDSLAAELREAYEAGRVHCVETSPVDLSSSVVRDLLRHRRPLPVSGLHPRVRQYIAKYALYAGPG